MRQYIITYGTQKVVDVFIFSMLLFCLVASKFYAGRSSVFLYMKRKY